MIIDDLRSENRGGRARISASVTWEDCERPSYELYFETDEAHSDGFFSNPHSFLIGCAIPAFHFGEKRVLIREEICPELLEGMDSVFRIFRRWYYAPDKKLLKIECKSMPARTESVPGRHAGFFFSGGVDSFATLCANRLHFPKDHPRSIKDGFVVFGLEQDNPDLFQHVLNSLNKFGGEDDFSIVPVYTNVYLVFRQEDSLDHFKFWEYQFGGAALASVAHAFSHRLDTVSIGSTWHMLKPWGSHPLIDHNFSSHDLRIIHDGIALTRQDKIKLIAGWDMALQNLRVCNKFQQYQEDMFNCGSCEKCLRTMLGLLAIGALKKSGAFPVKDVTPDMVLKNSKKMGTSEHLGPIYNEIVPELVKIGRNDLASAIQTALNSNDMNTLKSKLVEFDRRYLGSRMVQLKKKVLKGMRTE